MQLRPAEHRDIAFLMAAERRPGYDRLVGRFTEAEHRINLADPAARVLLACDTDGAPLGFVLLRDIAEVHGNLYVKRVVVATPDRGTGSAMMRAALDWIFRETGAYRVWLTTMADNHRAQHVYRKLGFVVEGLQRQAYRRGTGEDAGPTDRGDLVQLSLLRPEWQASTAPHAESTIAGAGED